MVGDEEQEEGRLSLKDRQKKEKRKNSMEKKRRKRAQQERTKEEESRVEGRFGEEGWYGLLSRQGMGPFSWVKGV